MNVLAQTTVSFDPQVLLSALEQAPGFFCFLRGRKLVFEQANASHQRLTGKRQAMPIGSRLGMRFRRWWVKATSRSGH